MRSPKLLALSLATFALFPMACDEGPNPPNPTEYTSEIPAGQARGNGPTLATDNAGAGAVPSTTTTTSTTTAGKTADTGATPGGRVADVKEADVYRIHGDSLFLLNTYRGFMIFDIADAKQPALVSNLPIYGYPVEMFVEDTTVYVLLADALYLTKVAGQLQFVKRNTSQIVSIDIANPAAPRVLQTFDLAGQLREGVSRKIEDTLYVVSYQPAGYWWYGWGARGAAMPNEQAWVYSFDTSAPAALKQVQALKVFEGGQYDSYDNVTGENHSRYSSGVALSATANALMVVQNWYTYDSLPESLQPDKGYRCGRYQSDQESVVSLVDVSDPKGAITVAATFSTKGGLGDQFKQTYVYDAATKTGTYYGIFSRQVWGGSDCNWSSYTQNTVESWNIGGPEGTKRLATLDFGKPNETVRGSSFDVERQVLFAITAQSMDPMYAISFADRTNLKVLSAIDGLSGDMNLFRAVNGGKFLLAVGRDTAASCGLADSTWNNQVAVSLIDVRDLTKIRLVQRRCLDLQGAGWVSSDVNWNLDQAHKLVGLSTDGDVNVLTVPVSYSVQNGSNDWWWYRYETAVGIVSWDLSKYDDTKPASAQAVLTTHGAFVHPNGTVNRSVLFTRETSHQRSMLNISDTHLSFANIQDLDHPTLDAVLPLAENQVQAFRFGDYLVEEVRVSDDSTGNAVDEFRVKQLGGPLRDAPVLATITAGNLNRVYRHDNLLVMVRTVPSKTIDKASGYETYRYTNSLTVYDFTNPLAPVKGGTVVIPDGYMNEYGYYGYYCGLGYGGGYYFSSSRSQLDLPGGMVFASQEVTSRVEVAPTRDERTGVWTEGVYTYDTKQWLTYLDLRDPQSPKLDRKPIALTATTEYAEDLNLVADTATPGGFYVSFRKRVGQRKEGETTFDIVKYQAQRYARSASGWTHSPAISLPGTLTRVFANPAGETLFLTREDRYTSTPVNGGWIYQDNLSLSLLRGITVDGKLAAERLDTLAFDGRYPKSMVFDGPRAYLVLSSNQYNYWYKGPVGVAVDGTATETATEPAVDTSDRLVVLDMSGDTLASAYDQSTLLDNLELMGVARNRLFMNLQGDGVLVVDVSTPALPSAMTFYRTLGWVSGIEFSADEAFVPAGYFGLYQMPLDLVSTF